MRKTQLAVLALLAVSVLAAPTQATQILERRLNYITTQVPVLPDSAYKIRSAATVAAMTAQPIDTTVWTPIWDVIQRPESNVGLAADTVSTIFVVIPENPSGAPTAAMDTITVTCQVSMDGVNAVAATNAGFAAPVGLEVSSNNATYFPVPLSWGYAANGTAPTTRQLLPYRFIRFILTGDKVGAFSSIWKIPVPDGTVPTIGRGPQ